MLLDVLIAACAALAALGVMLIGFKVLRTAPPRWLGPVVAAIAVVAVTATLRYQWANRMEAMLPPEMVVIERLGTQSPFEPWSYLKPVTTTLVVADRGTLRTNPAHADLVLINVLVVGRARDTLVTRHLVDCAGRREAAFPANVTFTSEGLPDGLVWAADAPPALLTTACAL
jgi:hypothetical protein